MPPIRPLRRSDLTALIALEDRCFAVADRFPPRVWRHLCGPALTRHTTVGWVIEAADGEAGRLAAAILLLTRRGAEVARIYTIAVDPACRGQGLAKRLLATACTVLPDRITTFSLEVRVDNLAAKALYDSLGFRITTGLEGYYADGGHGVRMRAPRATVQEALLGKPGR